MSVSSGFFNSLNGDRKYNAAQMSAIFDGLIIDGVFASIGTAFAVKAAGGLTVNVGIGKAWFDHTWTVNDSILPMTAPEAEVLLDRIDAVVLEVNGMESVRNNTIKFVKGNPSSAPSRPTLTNEGNVHQYPLCYIYRKYGTAVINQADITPMVGTESTPFDVDSTDATAVAAEILFGKTAYVSGNKLTGTMKNNGAVTKKITTRDEEVTIPQGFHDGSGKVGIDATEKGKLIANNIREGVTILGVEGTMSGSENMKPQAKTVTPSTAKQTILPDTEYNCLSQVEVEAIPYVEADNPAGGVTVTIAG